MSTVTGKSARRRRWPWIVAAGAIVVILAGVGITAFVRWLLAPPPPLPPLPAALLTIPQQWTDPILVPTHLPDCLTYMPGGSSVESNPLASGSQALQIEFAPQNGPWCRAATPDPNVVLTEARALDSLPGPVSTVSFDRLQFAQIAFASTGGTRVTLQWHCLDMMCRLDGTTTAGFPASALVAMAASVDIASP